MEEWRNGWMNGWIGKWGTESGVQLYHKNRNIIIGHHARTLELPLLVRSVSQARAES